MVLHSVAGNRIGDDTTDLANWLTALEGCPTVTHTYVLRCGNETHEEEANWFYVEADSANGVLRRRCLGCGLVTATLDSEERWTWPQMWACDTCGQSIAEMAAGLHAPGEDQAAGPVSWVAIGVRCVGCGSLAGVADFVLPAMPYHDVVVKI